MLAGIAEDFGDQLRGAVRHQMMLGEFAGRIDQAHQLDDALDACQVAAAGG